VVVWDKSDQKHYASIEPNEGWTTMLVLPPVVVSVYDPLAMHHQRHLPAISQPRQSSKAKLVLCTWRPPVLQPYFIQGRCLLAHNPSPQMCALEGGVWDDHQPPGFTGAGGRWVGGWVNKQAGRQGGVRPAGGMPLSFYTLQGCGERQGQ
jgi:hypothetical protein